MYSCKSEMLMGVYTAPAGLRLRAAPRLRSPAGPAAAPRARAFAIFSRWKLEFLISFKITHY